MFPASADTLRLATFSAPLSRDGPGLLLRDLAKGDDESLTAIAAMIAQAQADILVLTDFDYDADGLALASFAGRFGTDYPYRFANAPNTGVPTGHDIDQNGRLGDARDAHGYGRFAGDGGMAILSRYPLDVGGVTDHSGLVWRDLAGAVLPQSEQGPYFPDAVAATLRLSTTGHWIVPVILPNGPALSLLAFAATPPVFDGTEDRNGLRARDELRLWEHVLDGVLGPVPPNPVIIGKSNLDPTAGQGDRAAMQRFLDRPDLQDPHPDTTTADWNNPDIGPLRVSYILPSRHWQITAAGTLSGDLAKVGPHALVWVDLGW